MQQKILFEVIWIIITIVVITLLMLPIYFILGDAYPFYRDNILIIAIAITFLRYIFLLKHHWLSYSKWIKLVFVFITIPIFFFLVGAFYDFQSFYDTRGMESLMDHIPYKKQSRFALYIRTQLILFFTAAFISNFLMPFRMVISIWRKMHKGTH